MSVMDLDVLSTPGHLISLAGARVRPPERRPPQAACFGVDSASPGRASGWPGKHAQRDLVRFARSSQPPMAQMSPLERDPG